MEKYAYFREQLNLLTQFAAAFDDCFLYRYTKEFEPKEKIAVRYVFGPKHRVLFDIVDQAKNMTLPVIAMEQTNVRRDSSRIQFKDQKFRYPNLNGGNVPKIPTPVPITMDIAVNIVANYKEDIDQIVSNFIPWCNPYFIISWKVPEEFGLDFTDEIRTEVTWNGEVTYENPIDIDKTNKYKIIGTTSFNLKGWLFPSAEAPSAPIYVVRSNFIAVGTGEQLHYDAYPSLSSLEITDVILISAYPDFTNCFINGIPYHNLELTNISDQTFTFYGRRYGFNNTWYLSSNSALSGFDYEEIVTAKYPTISAYRIPDEFVTTVNDNIAVIHFSSGYVPIEGNYTFVTRNDAGWGSSCGFSLDANPLVESFTVAYNGVSIVYNGLGIIYSTQE